MPEFIQTGTPTSPKLWYQTFENSDVGTYTIRLYGGLIRRGVVIDWVYTDFILEVLPVVMIVSPNDTEGIP